MRDVYLGRQPIPDRHQRVAADARAAASAIQYACGEPGVPAVRGNHPGFLSIGTELLPKRPVGLELRATAGTGEAVVERRRTLKQQAPDAPARAQFDAMCWARPLAEEGNA